MPWVEETVSDRDISALALVKVAFDRHSASYRSCFEPFLEHCMFKSREEVVSIPDLQEAIESKFGLQLPQAVIKTLLRRQEGKGHVVVENETCRIRQERLEGADLEADLREAMRQQAALLDALLEYAHECNKPWSRERARELLLEYVEQFSTRLLDLAVSGADLPEVDEDWEEDHIVVHTFVLHAEETDPRSFEFLEVLVKGQMLADSVYLGEQESLEQLEPLAQVEVFLDTPILLRLLGYAGEEMAAPYLELLEMLKRQKAITRCFDKNIEEAERILAAAERAAADGVPELARGDVVAHLATRAKPSDIALMARRLPRDLLKLGIQPIPLPHFGGRQASDNAALSKKLKRRTPGYSMQARAVDAEAVVAVNNLRRGITARSLPKCKAVFVTRNYSLFKISNEFLDHRSPGPTIPACIPMSAFTTMVWVRQPMSAPKLPRERIIGDAYAAMSPSYEGLWRAVSDEATQLRDDEEITAEDAHQLRVRGESACVLQEEDQGDAEPYLEGDAQQVNQRAEETARKEARWRKHEAERRAKAGGAAVARLLFAVVIPLLAAGIVFGPLGIVSGSSPLPPALQWVGTAIFASLGLWSFFDGLSLHLTARRTASSLERAAVRIVFWFLGYTKRR